MNPWEIKVRVSLAAGGWVLKCRWGARSFHLVLPFPVKTVYPKKTMPIDSEMLRVLENWRARTQFSSDEDWVFASPTQLGRLPWSADGVNDAYHKATSIAGIGHVTMHSMRHTYRSWLDAVGTPIAVQQKLTRHADIRTTMNVYGDVVTDEMEQAHSKVVRMALAVVN